MIRVSEKQPELFKAQVKRQVPVEKESVGMIYQNANGSLYQGNSFEWLKTIESESVDLIFADPPYNINKTDLDKFESQEKYIEWSMQWIEQASRILSKTGTLYICGFSEILADLKHPSMWFFKSCNRLVWYYKNKANLGND